MLQRLAVPLLSIALLLPACEKPTTPQEESRSPNAPSTEADEGGRSEAESPEASTSMQAKGALPSGVEYTILKSGTGRAPRLGSTVRVHLTGWLPDGKEFLNTKSEGKPETYRVDSMELIPGLVDTLVQMKEGEQRRIHVPSAQAYKGAGYTGVVPPNADLDFEIELVSVEP